MRHIAVCRAHPHPRIFEHRMLMGLTIFCMPPEPASQPSAVTRAAAATYEAQAHGRVPILDGPWWLGLTVAVGLGVLTFGHGPWKWLALLVVAALLWLPYFVRWTVAICRSVRAAREEWQS
jgi:hypothetical protein